jgi:hypothetical protein
LGEPIHAKQCLVAVVAVVVVVVVVVASGGGSRLSRLSSLVSRNWN